MSRSSSESRLRPTSMRRTSRSWSWTRAGIAGSGADGGVECTRARPASGGHAGAAPVSGPAPRRARPAPLGSGGGSVAEQVPDVAADDADHDEHGGEADADAGGHGEERAGDDDRDEHEEGDGEDEEELLAARLTGDGVVEIRIRGHAFIVGPPRGALIRRLPPGRCGFPARRPAHPGKPRDRCAGGCRWTTGRDGRCSAPCPWTASPPRPPSACAS